eukprot:403368528
MDFLLNNQAQDLSPSIQLSRVLKESGLDDYKLSTVIDREKLEQHLLNTKIDEIDITFEELINFTFKKLLELVTQIESNYYYTAQSIVNAVESEKQQYLKKRRNIFTMLSYDQGDKKQIESFNRQFLITGFEQGWNQSEVTTGFIDEEPEEIKLDDYLAGNGQHCKSLGNYNFKDQYCNKYQTFNQIEESQNMFDKSISTNQLQEKLQKFNTISFINNSAAVNKFNPNAFNEDVDSDNYQEEIPEEINEDFTINAYILNQNEILTAPQLVSIVESSTNFDKNILFEVPVPTKQQIEVTKILPKNTEGHICSEPYNRSPIQNSIDLSDRDDLISMTLGNQQIQALIQEEEVKSRMSLKSEQVHKSINVNNYQVVSINNASNQGQSDSNLDDSLDRSDDRTLLEDSLNQSALKTLSSLKIESTPQIKVTKLKQIGSGTQADVYTCHLNDDKRKCYVTKTKQIINNEILADQTLQDMKQEFDIAKDLKHPNIIKYLNFCVSKHNQVSEFNIILEYMQGGNLKEYIQRNQNLIDLDYIICISRQILYGLSYLHDKKIIHQDLKPHNILFDKTLSTVKLADFGVSNIFDQTKATHKAQNGTLRYMSPEQLESKLTQKIDIWAFGCILLEMLTGIPPYFGVANEFQIARQIDKKVNPLEYLKKKQDLSKFLNDRDNMEIIQLIESCFEFEYEKRPIASELLSLNIFN